MTSDPVLPYGGDDDPNSGFAQGAATSEERARRDDTDGTTAKRQARVLEYLGDWRSHGATWKQVADDLTLHHGQASGVLSNLHKAGKIARLTERRHRCFVYVLPEYVNGRDTQEQGRPKQPEDGLAVALIQAEATIVRIEDLLPTSGCLAYPLQQYDGDTCLSLDDAPVTWCLVCQIREAIGRDHD